MGPWSKNFLYFVRSVLTKKSVFRPNSRKSEGPTWPKMGSPNLELFSPIFNKSPYLSILVNFGQNGAMVKNFSIFREVGPYEKVRFQAKLKKIWGAKMTKNGVPKFGTFFINFQQKSISVNFGQFWSKWGHGEKFFDFSWGRSLQKSPFSGQIEENLRGQNDQKMKVFTFFKRTVHQYFLIFYSRHRLWSWKNNIFAFFGKFKKMALFGQNRLKFGYIRPEALVFKKFC